MNKMFWHAFPKRIVLLLLSCCSVGVGEGEVSGIVNAPGCGIMNGAFDLRPNFFVADEFEGTLDLRLQHGGDFEFLSNGMSIFVADAAREANRLGTPISVHPEAEDGIRMNFYLHKDCTLDRNRLPVHYVGIEGEVIFESIYAPELNENQLETTARFQNVRFVDLSRPEERFAILSGEFSFLYNRGRPAQRYP